MSQTRLEALEAMRRKQPADGRILFALAMEYEKLSRWQDMVTLLEEYLGRVDDQGNAYGRLGHALWRLGRLADARAAYARGIEAAQRHHHPGMAAEFRDTLEQLEDAPGSASS
jgi:E3 SUMO-protein ligase RanBP2